MPYLDQKTARRVNAFTASAGITPEFFLSKIANEWLDAKGEDAIRYIHAAREKDASASNVVPITEGVRLQA